jgi:hypothetical protein
MKSLPCRAGCWLLLLLTNGCGETENSHSDSGEEGSLGSGGATGQTTGGTSSGGMSSGGMSSGSMSSGSTASGGSSLGGSAGSSATGGTSASSSASGGAAASGSDAGGTATSGAGAGGAAGCVDACELYGPPCCIGSEACIEPGDSCVIDILGASVDVIYEYAALEQKVAELPEDVLVSITDADIAFAAADPSPAARFEFELTAEAETLHSTTLEDDVVVHPFWLSCNGQRLFVGVTYLSYGAAAIKTPVLHMGRNDEGRWVLALGAFQGAWGLSLADTASAERIDRPELRAAFCQRGALRELEEGALPPDL